ncbi:MAG: hypothetical protein RMM58_07335 [Chloroflexota bacterium]|nr:hypothetical protein [Dehalococcoidia bacterium]MDW8253672.1 hypothetical protein [Chloroflexota bacterium]
MSADLSPDRQPPPGWLFLLRLLAWEHVILGTLSLIGGALALVAPPDDAPPPALAPLYLAAGGALVVAGAGVLSYRPWGRTLSIALALLIGGLSTVPTLVSFLTAGVLVPPAPIPMAHALLSIGLLTRPSIRRVFGLGF